MSVLVLGLVCLPLACGKDEWSTGLNYRYLLYDCERGIGLSENKVNGLGGSVGHLSSPVAAKTMAMSSGAAGGLRWARILLLGLVLASLSINLVWGQGAVGAGIGALSTMLEDKDAQVRLKAVQSLQRVGGRQSVLVLRQSIGDRDLVVALATIDALAHIGGQTAVVVLAEGLKDRRPQVRLRAVEGLRQAGTVNGVPFLQRAFGDREVSVRLKAALMLRMIGHRSVVPVLGRVAKTDKSRVVRAAAAGHLGKVGVKDQGAVGHLRQVLQDREPAVRLQAVESLGKLQLPTALTVLQEALEDPVAAVRLRATEVLGRALAGELE